MTEVLENGAVRLEIDTFDGRIVGLRHGRFDISLVTEPRLAENFRLLLPLPHRRGHYVIGRGQELADLQIDEDRCQLTWRGLRSDEGEFAIEVTQTIRLDGDDVVVTAGIVNRSPYQIEEVSSFVLGGLHNALERTDWRIHLADQGGKGQEWSVYDTFPGTYLGPAKPVWFRTYPGGMAMPWIDLYHVSADKGVYIGNHDLEVRLSAVWAELTPSTTHGGPRGDGQYWPDARQAGDQAIGLAVAWNSFPFLDPGASWNGPPITIHFHQGNWWQAASYFRTWFDTHTPIDKRRSWLAQEDAWQSTIISYPEGSVGYRFADLPTMARHAREAGINVLQIDGWDVGGIDRDYPCYSPDPRLGTPDELRAALAECRQLGVRVMLFANLQWVNLETDWYRDELHRYAVRDPYGNTRGGMGWEYNTTLGLLGQTIYRMVMANAARPEFRQVILDQLGHLVELGAPGAQIDKLLAVDQIDYSPDSPAPRDCAIPAGTLDTLAEFVRQARASDPDFVVAAEAHWDRAVAFVDASYSRFFSTDHLPTFAAVFPEYRQSCCVTGDFDYGLVNNCLRFGHIINVEARCLHATAEVVPQLSRYVAEALRIRRVLWDRIWESRLVDPRQVQVDGPPSVLYCVHRSLGSQSHTVVLNHFEAETQTIHLDWEGSAVATLYRPFQAPQAVSLPARVAVPAEEFVVVAFE